MSKTIERVLPKVRNFFVNTKNKEVKKYVGKTFAKAFDESGISTDDYEVTINKDTGLIQVVAFDQEAAKPALERVAWEFLRRGGRNGIVRCQLQDDRMVGLPLARGFDAPKRTRRKKKTVNMEGREHLPERPSPERKRRQAARQATPRKKKERSPQNGNTIGAIISAKAQDQNKLQELKQHVQGL